MNKTTRMIAAAIKQVRPTQGGEEFQKGVLCGIASTAHALSEALGCEYPMFDKVKFLRSCGVHSLQQDRQSPETRQHHLEDGDRSPRGQIKSGRAAGQRERGPVPKP